MKNAQPSDIFYAYKTTEEGEKMVKAKGNQKWRKICLDELPGYCFA